MPTILWRALYQVNTTDDPGPLANVAATNEQSGSAIVALTGDRMFVAWNDFSTNFSGGLEPSDSVGQVLSPLGAPNGGEVYLSGVFGDGSQQAVDIAALPNGGFIAAYQTQDFAFFTHGENVSFQVFDAGGIFVSGRSNGTPNDAGSTSGVFQLDNERDPSVVAFADGSFMIVYEDDSAGNSDIRGVVVDATGAEQPFFAIDAAAAGATRPDAATLSNGNMAVVYQSAGAAEDILFSVRTNTGGAVAAGTAAGGASNETAPAVAALRGGAGGFVAVWADTAGDGAGNAGIKVRLYSNAGVAAGAATAANLTVTAGAQTAPTVTGLLDGGFMVAWVDGPSGAVRARRFDAAGAAIESEFVMASLDALSQPRLTTLEDGRVALSVTNTDGTGDDDIYAAIWDPRAAPVDGTGGDDVLTGRRTGGAVNGFAGNDTLYAAAANIAGADTLNGGAGDDTLIGDQGFSINTMNGGANNDRYYSFAASDVINESFNEGLDTVFTTVNRTLSPDTEVLYVYGAAISGTGNGLANTLNGFNSANGLTLDGAGGNDVIYGSNQADTLIGGTETDTIYGYGGTNQMQGGDGDDTYRSTSATDVITEALNQGLDTLYSTVNVLALAANVERLILHGAATSGTGNGLANLLNGRNSAQGLTLDGAAGDDVIYGSNQSDTLIGGADNDRLFGYGGTNDMQGGDGNDTYYTQSATDTATENFNQGTDLLYSTLNVAALAANVEQLIIYGGATSGVGNGLDNTLAGNSSALAVTLDGAAGNDVIYGSNQSGDVLIGGANDDQLFGLGGSDFFRYAALGTGADRIYGFDADPAGGQDLIDVSGRGFNAGSIGGAILIAASGADTLITIGADTIRLNGVNSANVTATDFLFV